MEWLKNLSKAIEYIESNLDNEISYENAAKIACCSSYYFQRMFTYVAGITLSDYIRRRRMSLAAFDLQRTEAKVLDIASKYGYASPTSFNRAFRSVHGISPKSVRKLGSKLNSFPPLKFSVEISEGSPLTYHIEQKGALHIVGFRIPLVEDMEKNRRIVPLFWNRILNRPDLLKLYDFSTSESKYILGVTAFENPQNIFYYIGSFRADEKVQKGMYEYTIPAATWVVFETDGHFKESVQNIFQRFYKEWLLFSDYEYAGLPDIEVYPFSSENNEYGHSQVWIAIKKRSIK